MRFAASSKARSGFVAAGVAVAGALSGSAEASVIRPTASLPLIDVSYISPQQCSQAILESSYSP